MTACPARIVGVTRLLLDVMEDLGSRPPESLSPSEMLFLWRAPDEAELQDIFQLARKEMNALAPAVLAT
ncbi:MAG: hypothetical protein V4712_15065 [Pseudomonadota bacterium]